MVQFQELLGELGRKISWDIQVSVLPTSGKLEDTLHPLHPSTDKPEVRRQLNNTDLDGFINGINSFNK